MGLIQLANCSTAPRPSPAPPGGFLPPSASVRAAARAPESAAGPLAERWPGRHPHSWPRPWSPPPRPGACTPGSTLGWMSSSRLTSARVLSPFQSCWTIPRLNSTVKIRPHHSPWVAPRHGLGTRKMVWNDAARGNLLRIAYGRFRPLSAGLPSRVRVARMPRTTRELREPATRAWRVQPVSMNRLPGSRS